MAGPKRMRTFLGLCLLLIAAAFTHSQAARLSLDFLNPDASLPHKDPYRMQVRYDHESVGVSDGMMMQSSLHPDMHVRKFGNVMARELVSAAGNPPPVNVAHTDYICADSC